MHRWLLNHFDTAVLMLLFVVVAVGLAFLVLRLMRRFVASLGGGEQNEVTVLSVELIGAVYGIILGFVIVALWEGYNAADDNVAREATALSSIVRNAEAFPSDARDRVTAAVGTYVHSVVDEEFGLLREGHGSPRAAAAVDGVYAALRSYEPHTETQQAFYASSVSRLDEMLAARRTRLEQAESSLPDALRFMMYAGFVLIVTFMAAIGSARPGVQTVMLLGVTAIIAFNLVLATTLDYPFSGDVSVSSEPFTSGALAQFFTH